MWRLTEDRPNCEIRVVNGVAARGRRVMEESECSKEALLRKASAKLTSEVEKAKLCPANTHRSEF